MPRFGVTQGVKPDGTVKVRAVDHFSWSQPNGRKKRKKSEIKSDSINGHFAIDTPIHHDHLDDLLEAMRMQKRATGQVVHCLRAAMQVCLSVHWPLRVCQVPGLWKADIDSAFRRVPLQDSHKWAAVVAYIHDGVPWVAQHHAMPFGATASVSAWHRVGGLLLELARRLLQLPIYRYVDDYFAAERSVATHGPLRHVVY